MTATLTSRLPDRPFQTAVVGWLVFNLAAAMVMATGAQKIALSALAAALFIGWRAHQTNGGFQWDE
jgi:hypothetical protein